jgi:hypothetical protein
MRVEMRGSPVDLATPTTEKHTTGRSRRGGHEASYCGKGEGEEAGAAMEMERRRRD